jgi:hypothetical protein
MAYTPKNISRPVTEWKRFNNVTLYLKVILSAVGIKHLIVVLSTLRRIPFTTHLYIIAQNQMFAVHNYCAKKNLHTINRPYELRGTSDVTIMKTIKKSHCPKCKLVKF